MYIKYKQTFDDLQVVGSLKVCLITYYTTSLNSLYISYRHQVNVDRQVHKHCSNNDEVIEVGTGQLHNPVSNIKIKIELLYFKSLTYN